MKFIVFGILLYSLKSVATETVPVEFEWEMIPGSTQYEVQISNQKRKLIKELQSENQFFKTDLEPGKYLIRGRVRDRRKAFSEWSDLSDFTILPPTPKLIDPPAPIISPDLKTFTAEVPLKWDPTPGAASYLVLIKDDQGKIVLNQKSETPEAKLSLKPGKYRYELFSVSKKGIQSEPLVSENFFEIPKVNLKKIESATQENEKLTFKKSLALPVKVSLFFKPYFGEWSLLKEEVTDSEQYDLKENLKPGEYKVISQYITPDGELSEPLEIELTIKPESL